MKKTISEKAVEAINQLNQTALLMHKQMKSSEFNLQIADKAYLSAHRKVKSWRKSFFLSFTNSQQMSEFNRSGLERELETANDRFGRVLKHYARAVGAEFHQSGDR